MASRLDRHLDGSELTGRRRRFAGGRAGATFGTARLAVRLAWAGIRHRPRRQSVADRLAALPTRGLPIAKSVEIRWNDRLVPFIEAQTDRDLAVALGLIHAHLRLAQMEFMRRIAYGRLAEAVGAAAVPLDHALRLLDPPRAVPAILDALPDHTRDWLGGFVAGINHHLASDAAPPLEFRLLGLAPEPWTIADVLAVGRLAAADVNWLLWLRLLQLPRGDNWAETWAQLIEDGTAPMPVLGAGGGDPAAMLSEILLGLGRSGSNAVAVSGRRSVTGQPWVAGDPHLSVGLPSVWLQAAYRSPNYNVAGLMIAGIPVMAIGRNRHLAWGGTNLHAASSDLFDLSGLPASDIRERRVRLPVRWSRPRELVLRETELGPIISDAALFGGRSGQTLALRWIGHELSDEMTALLAINRARDAASFRAAAEGFAVPGQNLVFADNAGRVGRLVAAWLPGRPADPPADVVSPPEAAADWEGIATGADFPAEIDPPQGFVISANDRPEIANIPVGWFFSPRHRAERLASLLWSTERVGFAELAELHKDVAAPAALELRDRLCAALSVEPEGCPVFDAFAGWNGQFDPASPGALAFEMVLSKVLAATIAPTRRDVLDAVWHGRDLLARELDRVPPEQLEPALTAALAGSRPAFRKLRCWGEAHRLRLSHPLGALPGIGRRYRFIDWPWPGSNDTLLKSSHGLVAGRHRVGYGSNARYVFDLSDPDANRVVILGGQDGAPGSAAFLDQAELFRDGGYIELPLDPATARARFPHLTVLEPALS